MSQIQKEVTLTVYDRGVQASRGSYSHFCKNEGDGIIQGVVIDKRPEFTKCSKVVRLKEHFVKGAIEEPPAESKNRKSLTRIWKSIPVNKRIEIHAKNYVHSMYPNHKGFKIEIV